MSDLAERSWLERDPRVPETRGIQWLGGRLPAIVEPWPRRKTPRIRVVDANEAGAATHQQVARYMKRKPWVCPDSEICFVTDLHADVDAFWRSLVASGGVAKTGPGARDFALTAVGREMHFIVGGDLFDKGPANLPLLEGMRDFIASGARVTLLAGNHDVRTLFGLLHAESSDVGKAHLFARMGRKAMTLFKEIFDRYVAGGDAGPGIGREEFRHRYFPAESWYDEFRQYAEGVIPPRRIEKEVRRVREKVGEIEARWSELGRSMGDLHRAVAASRRVFLEPSSPHRWLIDGLELCHRAGSCLFVHAGVDDTMGEWIRRDGIQVVNRRFREALFAAPFELYNGALGNVFRTKYRDLDHRLTGSGLRHLHGEGIYAIVHGHRNGHVGQRMMIREGMLNFECDASVDRNTRALEGLSGPGGAATVLKRDGRILGISTDHPAVKIFDPTQYRGLVTRV